MLEILFIVAEMLSTVAPLFGAAMEEMLVTLSGGDWGCGATAELLFNGDYVTACNALNALAP